MKQIQAFLFANEGASARRRLAMLLEQQPDKAEPAAAAVAKLVQQAYVQFHIQAVHDFCTKTSDALPAIAEERLKQVMRPAIERTLTWAETLRGVTEERLVQTCRARVAAKQLREAAALGATLLARARTSPEQERLCTLLGRGLADMRADYTQARAVVEAIVKKIDPTSPMAAMLARCFLDAAAERGPINFERAGQTGTRQLIEAISALRPALPGPNEVDAPTPEQQARFRDEAHAVLRAAFWAGQAEDMIDAAMILVDYCPTDPALVPNAAGVEERMFLQLGPRARLTAVRAFGQLGEIAPLRRALLDLAEANPLGQATLRLMAGIMGGLRHADFYPFLSKALAKTESEMEEAWVIDALGRIASAEAVQLLVGRLATAVKRRTEPAYERRASVLLTALGRIGRSPLTKPEERNRMVTEVVKLVDGGDRTLAFRAAFELFSVRLQELDPQLKAWAAARAVDAMWGHAPAGPEPRGKGGWRAPMMTVLQRLGQETLPAVLDAASKHASHYSGAMGALADVLVEIGDARAVPVLETMARIALAHKEDAHRSRLMEEKVFDVVTNKMVDLDRDDMVHTLLYTIMKIGGPVGQQVVLDFADQVQAGRLVVPGGKTASFLGEAKMKHGRIGEVSRRAEATDVDEKEYKKALADARGGLLTKKAVRIAAIALLGMARRAEAAPVLLEVLGDKDPMVAGAAHTALAQFMHPLPREAEFVEVIDALLAQPKLLKGRSLEQFLEFIRREVPKKPPYDRLLERQVTVGLEDGALVHQILSVAKALEAPKPKAAASATASPDGNEANAATSPPGRPPTPLPTTDALSELQMRRMYMQARRAWIAGGKRGEPPPAPEGFSE